MSDFVHRKGDYKIMRCRDGYVVSNVRGGWCNHGHFKKLDTCMVLIKLLERRAIPRSPYLRRSAIRLSTDDGYKKSVFLEIIKEK